MENTLFKENTEDLILTARQNLQSLDALVSFDARDQRCYQDCLDCLHSYGAYLYLPAEKLQEIAQIALEKEYIDFLGDFSRLESILTVQSLKTFDEIFKIDRKTFQSWPRCTNAKWGMWMSLRNAVVEKWDELIHLHNLLTCPKIYPILEEGKEYTLAEKIDLMCEQYLAGLQEYASFYPVLQEKVTRLSLMMSIGLTHEQMASQLKVSRERMRQIKEKFLPQIYEGGLTDFKLMRINTELIREIRAFEEASPRYKSLAYINQFFGCEDYMKTHVPVFLKIKKLFEVDTSGTYPYFDQPYFLPVGETVEALKVYVTSLIKVMGALPGAEIRPMNIDELLQALRLQEPSFDFDASVVLDFVHQHTWIECVEEEGEEKFQLNYSYLYDYQKIARIVYEAKNVNYDKIQELDKLKSTDGKYLKNVGDINVITRKNYSWVCSSGIEGILVYEESGKEPKSLIEVIKEIVNEYKIFTFNEVMSELKRRNYTDLLNENSVKIYILRDCVSSIDDAQLYCHVDYLSAFPVHRWRSRNLNIRNQLVAFAVDCLRSMDSKSMPVAQMNQLLLEEIKRNGDSCDIDNPVSYMRERECVRDLLGIKNKKVFLTAKALELTDEDIQTMGSTIKSRPKSSEAEQAEQLILEQLHHAEGKEVLLKTLKNLCMPLFVGKSNSYFYSFIKHQMASQIQQITHDGNKYLKLIEQS